MPKPDKLSAADWEKAALSAIERGGAAAVSVEAIARELGATKGSFYWHFENRDALLVASLARWEQQYTGRVIAYLDTLPSARARLGWLLKEGAADEPSWRVHIALGAQTNDPIVSKALERVSKRRIEYLEACYRDLGMPKAAARRQALLAYASYLGFLRLRVEGATELPDARGRAALLGALVDLLVP